MKTYTADELKVILEKHRDWCFDNPGGERANLTRANLTRANLTDANLTDADLTDADLTDADLTRANLTRANLTRANLTRAYLTDADLTRAYLTDADLTDADLTDANLTDADLTDADLTDADLTDADLTDADLTRANLTDADLTRANLTRANLTRANLTRANLTRAYLTDAIFDETTRLPDFQICPEKGAFIAWKKVSGAVLELQIPASAKRTSSLVGRKCRASKAKVIKAYDCEPGQTQFQSKHNPDFIWTVGKTHEVEDFNDDIRIECAPGLHFFITRKEAENY